MPIALRKFKITNIILKKSIFNENVISVILTHYYILKNNKLVQFFTKS